VLAYQASGSDSGNGSGDSTLGDAFEPSIQRGVVIKNPRFINTSVLNETLKSFKEFDVLAAEEELFTMAKEEVITVSLSMKKVIVF